MTVWQKEAKSSQLQRDAALRREPQGVDHFVRVESVEARPEYSLHRMFPVSDYSQFPFVVPPRQGNTRLRGTFRSFTKRGAPDSTSDRTADVELMLLNDQEFDEFLHSRLQSATYELDPSHNQAVDWRVPTTFEGSQTYHLVFSNSAGGVKRKFVEADFTLSFE